MLYHSFARECPWEHEFVESIPSIPSHGTDGQWGQDSSALHWWAGLAMIDQLLTVSLIVDKHKS